MQEPSTLQSPPESATATMPKSTAVRAGIIILASVVGVPVLIMGFVFTYSMIYGKDLDASSKAYAEERHALMAVVGENAVWDLQRRDCKARRVGG